MESPHPRSAGVTAAATFAILGCISALALWGYFFLNLLNAPLDEAGKHLYDHYPKTFLLLGLVPPSLIAIGIRVAVGVFQLRAWARRAAMLWAALALVISVWLIAFRPFETFVIPEHFVSPAESMRQLFAISFVFMLLPASIWWLYLFRMKTVKAQFAQNEGEEVSVAGLTSQNGTVDAHKAVT